MFRRSINIRALLLFLLAAATPAISQPQGPSRPLWLTHGFGVPATENGLGAAALVNAHTADGVTFLRDSTTAPGYVVLSADSTCWSGVQHDLFLALDADHDDAGTLRLGYRAAPADTQLSFVEAVNIEGGGSSDRHVFHVAAADLGGNLHVEFSGYPDGVVLRRARLVGPPGPYAAPEPPEYADTTFSTHDPLVITYYFYWYDIHTNAHIINGDGSDALQDHPAEMEDFSFASVDWHERELRDMMAAGIDVAIPVYWGASSMMERWAVEGLERLVDASRRLVAEGERPPKIGMFFDASTLEHGESVLKLSRWKSNLTDAFGRAYFAKHLRDFYSLVPPDLRARVDGKPLVVLYAAAFAASHDYATFPYASDRFAATFGVRPFIVKERSWTSASAPLDVAWGAALNGPQILRTAAVGPGYNDSAVPGRTTPIRDREDGAFYRRSWEAAISSGRQFVFVETWNELHEGTDIARSREYGDRYIEITRECADILRGPVRFVNPRPTGWARTLAPTVTVDVAAADSVRLSATSSSMEYSNDGRATWRSHPAETVALTDSTWRITSEAVPFGVASATHTTPNRFRAFIRNADVDTTYSSFAYSVWLGYPEPFDASVTLGDPDVSDGVSHVWSGSGDGHTAAETKAGRSARRNLPEANGHYFYFDVSDSLILSGSRTEVGVQLDYYDGAGAIQLQYDGTGPAFMDRYRSKPRTAFGGTGAWKTKTWLLSDAWFGNRQNGGADFRVWAEQTTWLHAIRVWTDEAPPLGIDAPLPSPGADLIGPATPNPFNAVTSFRVEAPPQAEAWVRIVNVTGQTVRVLPVPPTSAGDVRVTWDGADATGRPLASGVYFARLECSDTRATTVRRLTLLR